MMKKTKIVEQGLFAQQKSGYGEKHKAGFNGYLSRFFFWDKSESKADGIVLMNLMGMGEVLL